MNECMGGCLVESDQHLELEAWPWTNPSLCVPRWIRNRIAVKDDRADPYPLFGGTLKAPSLVPNALTLALDPAVRAPSYRMGWRYNVRYYALDVVPWLCCANPCSDHQLGCFASTLLTCWHGI
ncbi:unnamed protein product [Clonostachys byssicola]|uniref:Uncharacterized protein n=1 Tax=Clonostachys byssicola TaxID=160290 RepID=A0A9N9UR46_9HYPO|nr:unnamed protein product [Clonostachys byssicola]